MKILIISAHVFDKYSPRALRTKELYLALLKKGVEVDLICHRYFNAENIEFQQNKDIIDLEDINLPIIKPQGVFVIRKVISSLNAIASWLFEYPNIKYFFLLRRVFKKHPLKGYDAIITIAQPYPLHWGLASFSNKKRKEIGKIWIADCGDPYSFNQNHIMRPVFYLRLVERWFMRRCDSVIVPIVEAKYFYYKEFNRKITVIPQGLSFPERLEVHSPENLNNPIVFGYAGNILAYSKRARHFLSFLNSVELDFRFIIFTDSTDFFRDNLSDEAFAKCIIHTRISRYTMLEILERVDFLIYFPYEKPGQQPFKLIDYSFLKKPIFNYQGNAEDYNIFYEFMDRNYNNKYKNVLDLENHLSDVVAAQFLGLIRNSLNLTD